MFTGIIETTAKVVQVERNGSGCNLVFSAPIVRELKVDQSVSHNGVCLTVVEVKNDEYMVTVIAETLSRTNIGDLKSGDEVNLERSLQLNSRLDGHVVQGHVDATARCERIEDLNGSWLFTFSYPRAYDNLIVEKGSICVNGVSLTVAESSSGSFSVAIIPYTFDHTNFKKLTPGSTVNVEFDILGKYVLKSLGNR